MIAIVVREGRQGEIIQMLRLTEHKKHYFNWSREPWAPKDWVSASFTFTESLFFLALGY